MIFRVTGQCRGGARPSRRAGCRPRVPAPTRTICPTVESDRGRARAARSGRRRPAGRRITRLTARVEGWGEFSGSRRTTVPRPGTTPVISAGSPPRGPRSAGARIAPARGSGRRRPRRTPRARSPHRCRRSARTLLSPGGRRVRTPRPRSRRAGPESHHVLPTVRNEGGVGGAIPRAARASGSPRRAPVRTSSRGPGARGESQ